MQRRIAGFRHARPRFDTRLCGELGETGPDTFLGLGLDPCQNWPAPPVGETEIFARQLSFSTPRTPVISPIMCAVSGLTKLAEAHHQLLPAPATRPAARVPTGNNRHDVARCRDVFHALRRGDGPRFERNRRDTSGTMFRKTASQVSWPATNKTVTLRETPATPSARWRPPPRRTPSRSNRPFANLRRHVSNRANP
jgi:hypothetical protein